MLRLKNGIFMRSLATAEPWIFVCWEEQINVKYIIWKSQNTGETNRRLPSFFTRSKLTCAFDLNWLSKKNKSQKILAIPWQRRLTLKIKLRILLATWDWNCKLICLKTIYYFRFFIADFNFPLQTVHLNVYDTLGVVSFTLNMFELNIWNISSFCKTFPVKVAEQKNRPNI